MFDNKMIAVDANLVFFKNFKLYRVVLNQLVMLLEIGTNVKKICLNVLSLEC